MDTLRCLGRLAIESDDGEERRLRSRKHLALLVYLAAHRDRTYPRERLAGLFWDTEPRLARHSLSQALYDIVQSVPAVDLRRSATEVGMSDGALIYEAEEFEEAIRRNDLSRAVGLYRGDFAPDLESSGRADFERWIEEERHRLRRVAEMALYRYVRECDDEAQWGEMCLSASRLLRMNPLNEEAHRALMRGLWLKGDQAAAINHFEKAAPELERELPGGVSPDTQELVARIRSSRPRARTMAVRETARPEMVGRKEEFEALKEALDGIRQGSARMVRIQGEAGTGKTRLLEEFRAFATLEDVQVLESKCYAAESELPYAPVIDALQPVARATRSGSGDGESFFQLGHLFPELFDRPDVAGNAFGEPEAGRRRLFEEVAALLRGALADNPEVWIVEDLHWIDASSAALLHYLARRLEDHPILFVLTVRRHEDACATARELLDDPDLTGPGPTDISLAPLAAEDTRRLLNRLSGDALSEEKAARIHSLAGGNPFFALELMRASDQIQGFDSDGDGPQSRHLITRDLRALLTRRLRGLNPTALRILETVAVAGRHATPRIISRVSGLDAPDLTREAADLYERNLLRDVDGRLEFLHDITREFVYGNMGQLPQGAMHLAIGELLAKEVPDAEPAALARHFERGGDTGRAYEYALKAAKEAEERHAHEEAIRMARKATEFTSSGTRAAEPALVQLRAEIATGSFSAAINTVHSHDHNIKRTELLNSCEARVLLARALLELGRSDEAIGTLESVLNTLADSETGNVEKRKDIAATALYESTKAAIKANRAELAQSAIQRYAKKPRLNEPPTNPTALLASAAYTLFSESAEASLRQLDVLEQRMGHLPYDRSMRLLLLKGMAATRAMRWDKAHHAYSRGWEEAERRRDVFYCTAFAVNRGVLALEQGNWSEADNWFSRALPSGSQYGDASILKWPAVLNEAESAFFQGRLQDAQQILEEALQGDHTLDLSNPATAQYWANLGLIYAQRGESEAVQAVREKLGEVTLENLRDHCAIQNRYKIVWLEAYMRQITGAGEKQVRKTFDIGISQEKRIDPAGTLKLRWLRELFVVHLNRTNMHDESQLIKGGTAQELCDAGMGWFRYTSRRWYVQAFDQVGVRVR